MADVKDRIGLDSTFQLLFNDAAKTISDLKSREWSATTLAVTGIIGLDSLSHTNSAATFSGGQSQKWLIVFMGLIVIGHGAVILKCTQNLNRFRARLTEIVEKRMDVQSHDLFKGDFKSAIVDEGTILLVMVSSVWLGCAAAVRDILCR